MANRLYQYSIINALMDGVATGGIELSKLQQFGNNGLGTFESMDGEMTMIDSVAYQICGDGSMKKVTPSTLMPFAQVTRFKPTMSLSSVSLPDKEAVYRLAEEQFPHATNLYLALRLEATFASIKVRAVRGQTYKGQPLAELADSQSVNTYKDIKGTVFGFRSPPYSQGISVAGGHLHFVSEDRACGGHVLELEAMEAEMSGAVIKDIELELPETPEFNDAKLELDHGGIGRVEG